LAPASRLVYSRTRPLDPAKLQFSPRDYPDAA
jgi:hypothetical protein